MVTETSFILAALAVILGIAAGLWLSKIAEEELNELNSYITTFRHVCFVVTIIIATISTYLLSGVIWMFLIFALLLLIAYFIRNKKYVEWYKYLLLGISFSVASFHDLFFPVALLSCIFVVLNTSEVFIEYIKKKRFIDRAFATIKKILFYLTIFILPIVVTIILRVWYSG
jgi:hypothetical protein